MACADARSLGGGALVDVGQHHGGAGFAECASVGHADAAGTTGDDGDLPAQVEELRGVHRAVLSAGLDGGRFIVEYRGCERFSQVL
jgi:hypothetical protein